METSSKRSPNGRKTYHFVILGATDAMAREAQGRIDDLGLEHIIMYDQYN
jgi:hypothetical protein